MAEIHVPTKKPYIKMQWSAGKQNQPDEISSQALSTLGLCPLDTQEV